MDQYKLYVAAQRSSLPAVIDFTADCCRAFGIDDDAAFAIRLAVDEAVTNIVEHAYEDGAEAAADAGIQLCCWVNEHDFFVQIDDQGKSFDPEQVPPPELGKPIEEMKPGGLGLYFMRKLMDEVNFSFDAQGNRLLMIKRDIAS